MYVCVHLWGWRAWRLGTQIFLVPTTALLKVYFNIKQFYLTFQPLTRESKAFVMYSIDRKICFNFQIIPYKLGSFMSDFSFGVKVNILLILFKYSEKGCANDSSDIFTVTRVSILFIDHRIDVWELLCTAETFMQCFYLPGESHHVKIPFYLHQWVTVCENTDALHNTGLFMLNNVWKC